jgi:dolichol-phosphate mannosyltransferase
MREESRYIRGMVTWIGFRQYALPYRRDARYAGHTKYTFRKMIKLALDGVTSFSRKPLALSAYAGALTALLGFAYLVWTIVEKILWPERIVPGYASLMVVILFIGGVQLISIGILGDYVGRIFYESKRRPLYIVARTFGVEGDPSEGADER